MNLTDRALAGWYQRENQRLMKLLDEMNEELHKANAKIADLGGEMSMFTAGAIRDARTRQFRHAVD